MKKTSVVLVLFAMLAVAHCWESECLLKILDDMAGKLTAQDISKANDDVVAAINAPTTDYIEIYDNHLNYNSDYQDRVQEDTINGVFTDAETNNEVGFSDIVITAPTKPEGKARMYFYLVGACCYYFNPCVSLKLGYNVEFLVDAKIAELDDTIFKQSLISAKKAELSGTIKSKNAKNITPEPKTPQTTL